MYDSKKNKMRSLKCLEELPRRLKTQDVKNEIEKLIKEIQGVNI
jgi:hypothetical protein